MPLPVDISPWKPAPFALDGETVFAVGDVHGCLDEMTAMLDTISASPADSVAIEPRAAEPDVPVRRRSRCTC